MHAGPESGSPLSLYTVENGAVDAAQPGKKPRCRMAEVYLNTSVRFPSCRISFQWGIRYSRGIRETVPSV